MTDYRNRIKGLEYVSTKELRANPANFRRHPQAQSDALRGVLEQVGIAGALLAYRDSEGRLTLIDGHLRKDSAPQTWPVLVLDVTDDEAALLLATHDPIAAMAQADAAALDSLLRNVSTDSAAVQSMLAELAEGAGLYLDKPPVQDVEPQIDRAEELRVKWSVESGQLWQLGDHRLICGDCTDPATVARVMEGERADCVFTSPPYAVGVDYGDTYEDTIANLRAMLPRLAAVWWDIVAEGGFAVVNFGDIAPARNVAKVDEPCEYPMAVEYWPVFRAAGWVLWSRRIWCKPTPRVHAPWCIQSNRAPTDWEHLWTFKKTGPAIVKRVDGELRSASGWYQSSQMHGVDVGKGDHGAGMALGIADWMVNVHSLTGGIVFEPFNGTGTTVISCERMTRRARAVEISPGYVAVALERWAAATGKTPERIA